MTARTIFKTGVTVQKSRIFMLRTKGHCIVITVGVAIFDWILTFSATVKNVSSLLGSGFGNFYQYLKPTQFEQLIKAAILLTNLEACDAYLMLSKHARLYAFHDWDYEINSVPTS